MKKLLFSKDKQLRSMPFEDQGQAKYVSVKVKHKKVKKSTLRNKADKLFSLQVRSIGKCELAGKDKITCNGNLQCMHIITRGVTALRFNPMNVLCGCAAHHMYYTHHPVEWVLFISQNFKEKFKFVVEHKDDVVKKTEDLYRSVIERYTV